jgi:uncharacterized delta-60 repeat protein
MKRVVYLTSLAVISIALLTAQAAIASPALDPSFGSGGKLETFTGLIAATEKVAVAPNGDIYVAVTGRNEDGTIYLRRYLPDGKVDTSFGEGGTIAAFTQSEESYLELDDLCVDSRGRPYLIGTASKPGSGSPIQSWAEVIRFTATGELDPGYGSDGAARLELGLPAVAPGVYEPSERGSVGYVDAQGRVVLAVLDGPPFSGEEVIARLTSAGTLDRSFGDDGVSAVPAIGLAGLTEGKDGTIEMLLSPTPRRPHRSTLVRLSANGVRDRSFGKDGVAYLPGEETMLTRMPEGGALSIGRVEPRKGHSIWTLTRTTADGSLDRSFGKDGVARPPLPDWAPEGRAVSDGQGGAYLVGTRYTPMPGAKDSPAHYREILVAHITASGNLDRGFGKDGVMLVHFHGVSGAFGAQMTPSGRLLVDGLARAIQVGTPSRQALAEISLG